MDERSIETGAVDVSRDGLPLRPAPGRPDDATGTTFAAGGPDMDARDEPAPGGAGGTAPGGGAPLDDRAASFDRALVARACEDDLDAFNQLVVRHQDAMYALVARLVPDRDQAADAVQEAFFHAYRNLRSFRGGSVRSWLSRIAINAAMDLQRRRRRRPAQPYPELEDESWQPPADKTVEPEHTALARERSKALAAALAGLPAEQRTAIVLYDVEGYDYAEIAEKTGVSLGTVKSRIHRGRLALRATLSPARELFRG